LAAAEEELKDIRQAYKATGRQIQIGGNVASKPQLQKKGIELTRKRRKLRK